MSRLHGISQKRLRLSQFSPEGMHEIKTDIMNENIKIEQMKERQEKTIKVNVKETNKKRRK